MSERAPDGCLAGLRVVETGDVSAALAGRLLADLGAEVWKVEPPGGDPSRCWPPFATGPQSDGKRSWLFEYYNAGKRSLVADPRSARDRERLRAFVASADVWLDTSGPAAPSAWGLDAAALATGRLVAASLTPFGLEGPFAAWRANDLVAQAAGGMVFTNGWPGEAPLQGYGLQAFHSGSLVLLHGVLLALLDRERTGRGQLVEVSLQEAVASAVEETSAAWNGERRVEIRRGSMHWTRAFAVGRCRDGYVLYCTLGDWTSMHEWMKSRGHGDAFSGKEWDEFLYRRDHAEELFAELDRFVAEQAAAEVLEMAQALRLPFAEVRLPESLRDDPQLAARGFFTPLDDGTRFPGPPFRMSVTPLRTRSAAPACGSSAWPEPGGAPPERSAAPGPRRAGVLDGVRVLDFTHVVAGPVATRILADHGAEVLKVERRVTLDLGDRERGFFSNLNRGKKSLILNMVDPRGVELARRLAAVSDVVVDNFSARVMGNWGLDYEGLRKLRPDIVAVGMSGFGKTGPHRDYVSFGPTLHALAGYTRVMRHPGGEPAGWGYSYSDMAGGMSGAAAILAALIHRRRTGEGQFVDLSQYESVATLMGPALLALVNDGVAPEPAGNASQGAPGAPHGVYRCAGDDRWVAIAIDSDEEWTRFGQAVAEPWAREERFATAALRQRNRTRLDQAVGAWTHPRSPEEVTALLQSRGLAAFTVANGEDLCARDPHLQMRGYWTRVETGRGGTAVLDGVAARLHASPGAVTAPGPLHGANTGEVLRATLGIAGEDLESLRADGVIG